MSTILALDISSVSTGYAIFKNGRLIKRACGTIKMAQKVHGERLVYFEQELEGLIDKWDPEHILIEGVWKGRNIKTVIILSWYHGVAQKTAYKKLKKTPWVLAPTEIRKIVGEKFNENLMPSRKIQKTTGIKSKELTFNFIKSKYKLNTYTFTKNNDETDAIALALAGHILTKSATLREIHFGPSKKKARKAKKK